MGPVDLCWCCRREDRLAEQRWVTQGGEAERVKRLTKPVCDPCWNDPNLAYADCRHGD